jgi:hypothetical protein
MGIVMKFAKAQPDLYNRAKEAFYDLPSAMTLAVTSALISPGKTSVNQAVAAMSGNQLNALIAKIDSIFRSDVSTPISDMVAEEIRAAITLVRIISQAAQGSSEFAGILASGQQLDVWALRPKDVGGAFLNGAGAVALGGLYGGVSGAIFSWTQGVVANVAAHLIPRQTTSGQSPYGGLVIFGGIEKTYTPKIESISLILQGQPSGTVPAQPCAMTMKRTFGEDNDLSIFRLEKPVIITQNENFGVDIMPNVSGNTNFELVALMCGQVQNKVL